ncbi:MAG: AMP-binding protein, partial [Thermoanaerobaculia bacterium]
VLSHRALAAWRRQADGPLLPGPADRMVGWVPPWHVMGLLRFLWLPVVCGGEVHLVPPAVRTLGDWLDTAARVRATLTSASDFALRASVRLVGERDLDLGSLRCVVTGGEPVRASTVRAFEQRFGLSGVVRPAYGLSEATLAVTCARPGEPLALDAAGNVSCGPPLPGVELRIVDENGQDRLRGVPGEIWVRAVSLFSGYFDASGRSGLTADGWLATGDWGHLGPAGELFVLGRRRNLLKHGGSTFAPREFEEAAERVEGAGAAAAISLGQSGAEGDVLVLVAEVSNLGRRSAGELAYEMAAAVRGELGILPGEVILVRPGTLPRTDSGKLRHSELARRLATSTLERDCVLAGRLEGWSL